MAQLEISSKGIRQIVKVDGIDIGPALRRISVHLYAGGRCLAELDLVNLEQITVINTEAELEARIPEQTWKALVALGWSPPQT